MTTCTRCGDKFARQTPTDRHCPPCSREVQQIIASDTARRSRFEKARALTADTTL